MRRMIVGLLVLYLFIYVWAVPMLMLSLVPVWGTWMGGFLLILQGTILALWLGANAGVRGWIAATLIAVLSWAIEHVGVTTGWPFGRYSYTDVLGLKLFGAVPLAIPFAWLLVIPATIGAALVLSRGAADQRPVPRLRWIVVLAPILAFGLDLLLEPVAAYIMDYWHWLDTGPYYGVPTANFVAWFVTALVLTLLTLVLAGQRIRTARMLPAIPALLYWLILLQFTLVDLAHGYVAAALAGVIVLAGSMWRLRAAIAAAWRDRGRMWARLHQVALIEWRGAKPRSEAE